MWNDTASLETITRLATIATVVFGLAGAVVGIVIPRFDRSAVFDRVSLGLIAGILALLAALTAIGATISDQRAESVEQQFKRTPPKLEASLKHFGDDDIRVVIDSFNRVPFEYNWKLVTKNNVLVSGIFLEWGEAYPDNEPARYNERVSGIHWDEIVDDFVELRFRWRSVYAAERGTTDLSGSSFSQYTVTRDLVRPLTNE